MQRLNVAAREVARGIGCHAPVNSQAEAVMIFMSRSVHEHTHPQLCGTTDPLYGDNLVSKLFTPRDDTAF